MEPPPLEYSIFIREVTGNLPEFPSCEKQPYSEGRWFRVELHCRNYGPPGPGAIGIVNDNGRLGSVAWMHSLFVTEWVRIVTGPVAIGQFGLCYGLTCPTLGRSITIFFARPSLRRYGMQ